MNTQYGETIVAFVRMNDGIVLMKNDTGYFLINKTRAKEISFDLANYIMNTYKPGQLQPNSRYS
jgi:hypothetical protein